jgi:hypothetical protein
MVSIWLDGRFPTALVESMALLSASCAELHRRRDAAERGGKPAAVRAAWSAMNSTETVAALDATASLLRRARLARGTSLTEDLAAARDPSAHLAAAARAEPDLEHLAVESILNIRLTEHWAIVETEATLAERRAALLDL